MYLRTCIGTSLGAFTSAERHVTPNGFCKTDCHIADAEDAVVGAVEVLLPVVVDMLDTL